VVQSRVIIDQLNPLASPRITLSEARDIRIPDDIHRVRDIVPRPIRNVTAIRTRSRIPIVTRASHPAVRVQVVEEAGPGLAHQARELGVACGLVGEGVWVVPQALEVVEDERDFLEVRHFDRPGDAGWDRVEAIAVRWQAGGRPGLARQAAGGDEDFVAEVGCAAAVVGAVGKGQGDVATEDVRVGDQCVWVVVVGCEDFVD